MGHYPNTALFNPKKKIPWQGSGLSSLGRIMLKSQGLCHGGVPLFLANFPNGNGLLNDFRLPRRPLMVRAALLRRSCDGVAAATESLLRDGDAQTSSVALILRVASRRDALNEEPASFSPARVDLNFNGRGPQS